MDDLLAYEASFLADFELNVYKKDVCVPSLRRRGRPSKDYAKSCLISVRLSEYHKKRLLDFCRSTGISLSEFLVTSIESLT